MPRGAWAAGLALALLPGGLAAQDPMAQQRCVWACLADHGPNTTPAYHACVVAKCTGTANLDDSPVPVPGADPTDAWGFITGLVAQSLDVWPGDASPYFFVDHADPNTAVHALGMHYFEGRSGGNAIGLNAGLFRRDPEGWRFLGRVEMIGVGPRDVTFPPGKILATTTTLGPDDARCCPTQPTRWSIDVATRQAVQLP